MIGKYRIIRQIGAGGMGVVYEAVHEVIGQHVAVKVLHPPCLARSDQINRFFNEARAVNIVGHAGLVKTFDFGQLPDGMAYMVMELLEGEPLSSRLRHTAGELPLADALRIARQVASALCATHGKGIVHRDIKPDNIFLVSDPEAVAGERAKILDFGVARVRIESGDAQPGPPAPTATGVIMGTPMYMSPELCRGAKGVDDRTDVYALGVVLYQMLAGRPPFIAGTVGEVMGMHLTREPPPLRLAAPSVSEEVAALVHRLLAKVPAERPSAAEVVAELEKLGAERAKIEPRRASRRSSPVPRIHAGVLGAALGLLVGAGLGVRLTPPAHSGGKECRPAPPAPIVQQDLVHCVVTSPPPDMQPTVSPAAHEEKNHEERRHEGPGPKHPTGHKPSSGVSDDGYEPEALQ